MNVNTIICGDSAVELSKLPHPSGIDMTRDVEERLQMYSYLTSIEVVRIALNWDQIELWRPPENPAKETDARFSSYSARFGTSSWELDAIEPAQLASLLRSVVEERRDSLLWQEAVDRENAMRRELLSFVEEYENRDLKSEKEVPNA